MVQSLAGFGIHAPAGIVPGVALFQISITGSDEPPFQVFVLGKLGPDDLLHDADLHFLPVGTKLNLTACLLGLSGSHFGKGKLFFFGHALLSLKSSLIAAIGQALICNGDFPEITQESVFSPEMVDLHFA